MWDWAAAVNILVIVYGLRYMVVVIMAMTDDEFNAICLHMGIV